MTETHPKIIAGIDVGKAALELSVAAGPTRQFANTPDGITDLVADLSRGPRPLT